VARIGSAEGDRKRFAAVAFGRLEDTSATSVAVPQEEKAMQFDLVISGGRVFAGGGSFTGDVAVTGERIAALGTGLAPHARQVIDATGRFVIPGAIDGHVHMRTEREAFCYDDTFETGSVAAAFGGTTTIIDQVQAEYGCTLNEEVDTRMALAEGLSAVDFGFHMNIREPVEARIEEIPSIMQRGLSSFKWFMAIPGWGVPDDYLLRGMYAAAELGALNIVHAENLGTILEKRRRHAAAGMRDMRRFTETYPSSTEGAAIALALGMAEEADSRLLVFHNTCREGVAAIRAAKERGVRAFGEAGLAWLTHTDAVYQGDQVAALPFLLTPPVRDAQHQAALWGGLRVGDLDIVSTDHAAVRLRPEAEARAVADGFGVDVAAQPEGPETLRDAQGRRVMPVLPPGGVETRLPMVYSEGVLRGRLSLERWVEVCCTRPAEIFDLPQKGRLHPGCDADIVVFDPQAEYTYGLDMLHSNTDYSVWEGWPGKGRAEKVFSRGRMIVDGTDWLGAPDHGRFLKRAPAGG
jgi:dihydropyrimidinase